MWRWGLQMLRNCTEGRYRLNKCRMVRTRGIQPRRDDRLRAETGIAYDRRQQGTLQLFRTQKQLDDVDGGPRCWPVRLALRGARSRPAASPPSRAWRWCPKVRRRAAAARDETGDCRMFTQALAREGRGGRSIVPLRQHHRRASPARRPHHRRRAPSTGARPPTSMSCALGQLRALPAALGRHLAAGLPGQGLLDHPADHRRRGGAAVDGHGRDLQGRHHPARGPHPRRRHGRDRRLRPQPRPHRRGHRRATSVATSSRTAATSRRPSFWTGLRPMTPDGTPVIGPTRYREPLPQHRPRHARLDHGLRLRPRRRRRRPRPSAGDRLRRPDRGALRPSPGGPPPEGRADVRRRLRPPAAWPGGPEPRCPPAGPPRREGRRPASPLQPFFLSSLSTYRAVPGGSRGAGEGPPRAAPRTVRPPGARETPPGLRPRGPRMRATAPKRRGPPRVPRTRRVGGTTSRGHDPDLAQSLQYG